MLTLQQTHGKNFYLKTRSYEVGETAAFHTTNIECFIYDLVCKIVYMDLVLVSSNVNLVSAVSSQAM